MSCRCVRVIRICSLEREREREREREIRLRCVRTNMQLSVKPIYPLNYATALSERAAGVLDEIQISFFCWCLYHRLLDNKTHSNHVVIHMYVCMYMYMYLCITTQPVCIMNMYVCMYVCMYVLQHTEAILLLQDYYVTACKELLNRESTGTNRSRDDTLRRISEYQGSSTPQVISHIYACIHAYMHAHIHACM
jgi:hypothetical protein